MTYLENLIPSEIIQAIGWTLLHSLWQGMAIAFLLASLLFIFRNKSSQLRHALSVAGLIVMLVATFFTFSIDYQSITFSSSNQFISGVDNSQGTLLPQNWLSPLNESVNFVGGFLEYFNDHLPLIVLLWIIGIFFLGLRMIGELTYVYHLKNYKTQTANASLQNQLAKIARQLGIRKNVQLAESFKVKAPLLAGIFKPVILLPVGLATGLSNKQIESILAHELAHIKRHDLLINLLQSFAEVVLFFNPALWWISSCIRTERENCCDDLAIQVTGDKVTFVKTLAQLEEMRVAESFALTFTGRKIGVLHRIRRLLKGEATFHPFSRGFWGSFFLLAFLFFTAFTAKRVDNQDVAAPNAATERVFDIANLDAASSPPMRISSTEDANFEEPSLLERSRPIIGEMPFVQAAPLKIQPAELPIENSSNGLGIISKKESPVLYTVPTDEKAKRELELLNRRIQELIGTIENKKHELKKMETKDFGDMRRTLEMRQAELTKAAEELERENANLEKEGGENFQKEKERQAKELEEAVRRMEGEIERANKERVEEFEKHMVEQKEQINAAMKDLELQRSNLESKKGEISEEEYKNQTAKIDQAQRRLAQRGQVELARQKMNFERQMENLKMNLQFQKEGLDLQRKQMDLNWKQHESQLVLQRESILNARKELEMQREELANQDLEKMKQELARQQQKVAEDVEMLQMELKILQEELKERKK